mgnify:FL=1
MELALSCKFPVLAIIFGLPIVIRFVPIGDEAHRLTLIQKNSILVEVYWEILLSFMGAKLALFGVGCFRFYIIGFRKNIKTSNNEQFRQ